MNKTLASLLLVFGLASVARADTLASTFGPGDSFNGLSSRFVTGASTFIGYAATGITFTVGANSTLTSVEFAAFRTSGTNSFTVRLSPDASGQPGAPLKTWTTAFPNSNAAIVSLPSVSSALLQAGATYWLTASPGGSDSRGFWAVNNQGINSGNMKSQGTSPSQAWTAVGTSDIAYRISGTATTAPEPGTLALLSLGLLAPLARRRRAS